jgi:hypothetical protein
MRLDSIMILESEKAFSLVRPIARKRFVQRIDSRANSEVHHDRAAYSTMA